MMRLWRSRLLAPLLAPLVLLMFHHQIKSTSAIFNCFTPGMYKMGKVGAPALHSGERANWYPQSQAMQKQYYPNYYPGYYGESPMKSLFRPKWGMGSLFGPRKWMDWRMGANALQRPAAYGGYMTPVAPPGGFISTQPSGISGFQPQATPSEQLFNLPTTYLGGNQRFPTSSNLNNPVDLYSQQPLINDGWSVPYNQQQQQQQQFTRPNQQQQFPNSYDSYSVSPGGGGGSYIQPTKQLQPSQYDNYGTKGGKQQYNTTKK